MDFSAQVDGIQQAIRKGLALGYGISATTDLCRVFQGDLSEEQFATLVDVNWDMLSQNVASCRNVSQDVASCRDLSPLGALGRSLSPMGAALSEECRRSVAYAVASFIDRCPGEFSLRDVDMACGFSREHFKSRAKAVERLEKQGKVVRIPGKAGRYRVKATASEDGIDIENVPTDEFPLVLPFGLNEIVEIYPKEIILIAGETNGGKTSLIFWILWHTLCSLKIKGILKPKNKYIETLNLQEGRVGLRYLSSEMGASAIAKKVSLLTYEDASIHSWNQCIVSEEIGDKPIQDLVDPHGVNAIDYLEVNSDGDFAKMGCTVAEVFKALDSGVAIIATQKRKNSAYGVGGEGMKEKPRLSLTILDNQERGFSTLVISKAKHYRDWNPTGLQFDFKVTNRGGKIVPISGKWMRSAEIEPLRKATNYGQNNY